MSAEGQFKRRVRDLKRNLKQAAQQAQRRSVEGSRVMRRANVPHRTNVVIVRNAGRQAASCEAAARQAVRIRQTGGEGCERSEPSNFTP
jgi:hypothetical protein